MKYIEKIIQERIMNKLISYMRRNPDIDKRETELVDILSELVSENIIKHYKIFYNVEGTQVANVYLWDVESPTPTNRFSIDLGIVADLPISENTKSLYTREDVNKLLKDFAEIIKMRFYYNFDEIIPSIMADEIDKLLEGFANDGN